MGWKKWLGLLLAPALAVAAQDAPGSVKIQDHRSRWNYPTTVTPRQGQKLHLVEKGDTLWDLGHKYLGSPHAWPQIWELNRWVADPHWIYPGDPLLIPLESRAISSGDGPEPAIASLPPDRLVRNPTMGRVGYLYAFQDYLHLPYLAPKGAAANFKELKAIRITGCQKEERQNLSRGDIVYLGGGRDKGLQVGDRMVVLKIVQRGLKHPDSGMDGKSIGDVIQHAAILRVLAIHPKNAEAAIEDTLDGVEIGDFVAPFDPPTLIHAKDAPLRTDTREPIKLGTKAKVLYGRNGATYFGSGDLVLIDAGKKAGLKVGDVLLGIRGKQMVQDGGWGGAVTNRYLGQLLVVRADEKSSTCLVISTKTEMTLGDTVTK